MSEDKSQLAKHSVEEVVSELVPASRVGGAGLMVGGVFKLCTNNHLGWAGIILIQAVMLCTKLIVLDFGHFWGYFLPIGQNRDLPRIFWSLFVTRWYVMEK